MLTKKVFSVFLALLLILPVVSTAAFAVDDWSTVLTYYVDKEYEEVGITGCVKTAAGDLVIPEKINGYPVTYIDDGAFADCTGLTSVTIPSGVYYLYGDCFEGCTSLTAVNINAGNEDYSSVDGVVFDKEGTELLFCPAGKSGAYTVPDTVEYIEDSAFDGCLLIPVINIPDSVKYMDEMTFDGCAGLTAINVDAGNQYYSGIDGVLFDKTAAALLCYPEGRTAASYTVPDGVKAIADFAFEACSYITRVAFPDSLESFGSYVFGGCTAFTAFEVGAGNAKFSVSEGILFDKEQSVLICCPAGFAGAYTIPESTKYIAESAFAYCEGLTGITFPASLGVIGDGAFEGCSALISVLIPGSVTRVGVAAFTACKSLASVGIADGVLAIGDGAFYGCDTLMQINIPASVERVGYSIIEHTPIFDSEANWVNGTLYLDGCLLAVDDGKSGAFAVSEGTRVIAAGALYGCDSVTEVTLPAGLVGIGYEAFVYCMELTAIVIPDGVKLIGEGAFAECFNLESVTLPDTLEEIGYGAFADTVCYGDPEEWTDGTLYIGNYFIEHYWESTQGVTVREGTLGIASAACSFCEDVTSLSIPSSVRFIGDQAFAECPKLLTVTIPASVTRIGEYAFGYAANYETYTFDLMPGFTIRGLAGSEAQNYADSNKITFVAMMAYDPLDASAILVTPANSRLLCVKDQLTVTAFLQMFTDPTGMSVLSGDTALGANALVGTGCELRLADGTKLTVIILGDTDSDGKVTIKDARRTLRVSATLEAFTTAAQTLAADTDGDGKVLIPDARSILRAAADIAPLTLPAIPLYI